MTRINVGIDPRELPRQALLAEHREMKRVPNQLRSGRLKQKYIDSFRLGTGHVHFFTTRLRYLRRRYRAVHEECLRRGYAVQDFSSAFKGMLTGQSKYKPTLRDRKLLRERLHESGHVLLRIPARELKLKPRQRI